MWSNLKRYIMLWLILLYQEWKNRNILKGDLAELLLFLWSKSYIYGFTL